MQAILCVHGKGGSYLEAEQYKKNCEGFVYITGTRHGAFDFRYVIMGKCK